MRESQLLNRKGPAVTSARKSEVTKGLSFVPVENNQPMESPLILNDRTQE